MQTRLTKWTKAAALTVLAGLVWTGSASATGRLFTYTYEPEVMPEGAGEFEQWVTLRTQRTAAVGQDNYNRWDIREEFEYGMTDNYTLGFYLNLRSVNFEDPSTGATQSEFEFKGISIENRYMLLNPAEHPVGLTLYFEPTFSGEELELEEKIIIGQRLGEHWKWAVNFVHETEWELNEGEYEGVLELTAGITRQLNSKWHVGLEFMNHNVIKEYEEWEHTAIFLGPVVTHSRENFWATLTVLPQIWGKNTSGGPDPDGNDHLVLDSLERVNVRLIFGIPF
jgi:hypothetical protein